LPDGSYIFDYPPGAPQDTCSNCWVFADGASLAGFRHQYAVTIEAAEADREQTLTEARQRRERMERDARILVEQELKAVRDTLVHRTASDVVSKANALVSKHVTAQDHQRVADSYLDDVQAAFGHLKGARS
jgi:F0F1-type ATP synthase membrane subunit b/b'